MGQSGREWALFRGALSKAMVLQVRSPGQLHRHHLGTYEKFRFSGLTCDLLTQTLGVGLSPPGDAEAHV